MVSHRILTITPYVIQWDLVYPNLIFRTTMWGKVIISILQLRNIMPKEVR